MWLKCDVHSRCFENTYLWFITYPSDSITTLIYLIHWQNKTNENSKPDLPYCESSLWIARLILLYPRIISKWTPQEGPKMPHSLNAYWEVNAQEETTGIDVRPRISYILAEFTDSLLKQQLGLIDIRPFSFYLLVYKHFGLKSLWKLTWVCMRLRIIFCSFHFMFGAFSTTKCTGKGNACQYYFNILEVFNQRYFQM